MGYVQEGLYQCWLTCWSVQQLLRHPGKAGVIAGSN